MLSIIKLSDEGAILLYQTCPTDIFARIKQDSPDAKLLVIVASGDGARASSTKYTISIKPHVQTITGDTIGAGDCFVGGLLCACHDNDSGCGCAAHINKHTLTKLIIFADKVAGLNCQQHGYYPPRQLPRVI